MSVGGLSRAQRAVRLALVLVVLGVEFWFLLRVYHLDDGVDAQQVAYTQVATAVAAHGPGDGTGTVDRGVAALTASGAPGAPAVSGLSRAWLRSADPADRARFREALDATGTAIHGAAVPHRPGRGAVHRRPVPGGLRRLVHLVQPARPPAPPGAGRAHRTPGRRRRRAPADRPRPQQRRRGDDPGRRLHRHLRQPRRPGRARHRPAATSSGGGSSTGSPRRTVPPSSGCSPGRAAASRPCRCGCVMPTAAPWSSRPPSTTSATTRRWPAGC